MLSVTKRRSPGLPLGGQILIWLATAAALTTVSLYGLWLAYDKPVIDATTAQGLPPSVFFDALKVGLAVAGGTGAVVALVVSYRRQKLNESADLRDAERLLHERFSRASEQLGSAAPAIRLAGVYAMSTLADDWDSGRQVCIDVLCAYLRMPYHPLIKWPVLPEGADSPSAQRALDRARERLSKAQSIAPERPDAAESHVREAITRVISERLNESYAAPWFGHQFDFSGAVFDDLDLAGSCFRDCNVIFDDAIILGEFEASETRFRESRLSLLGTWLVGRVGFEYSSFVDSDVTVYADNPSGLDMNFQGVEVSGGKLDFLGSGGGDHFSFVEGRFKSGRIEVTTHALDEGTLAFSRATISGADVRVSCNTVKNSNLWNNGLSIESGSFSLQPQYYGTEMFHEGITVDGSEVTFENVLVKALGVLTIAGIKFSNGGKLVIEDLDLHGRLVIRDLDGPAESILVENVLEGASGVVESSGCSESLQHAALGLGQFSALRSPGPETHAPPVASNPPIED